MPTPVQKPHQLTTPEGFVAGALGACVAVTVTNPMEVAKTRLQLDGELQSAANAYKRVYTNSADVLKKTWQSEGIRGVQRGLFPAYAYQVFLNGSRIGFYEPFRRKILSVLGRKQSDQVVWINLTAGASSGVVGAIFGNPLFLIKARLQAFSPAHPVGAQHDYKSGTEAFLKIWRTEGLKGLYRGVDAAMLRTAMGSSVQLPAYNLGKSVLSEYMRPDSIYTYLLASTFSGACVCAVMQPADTALTRMYNQSPNSVGPDGKPRGLLYKNPIDCLWKTFKVEGFKGLYKGTTAHLLRIAPHTVITLVANEGFVKYYLAYRNRHLEPTAVEIVE